MMKIGPVNPIAVVSANGMCGNALNHITSPTVCTAPRENWPPTRLGQYAAAPARTTSGNITTTAAR